MENHAFRASRRFALPVPTLLPIAFALVLPAGLTAQQNPFVAELPFGTLVIEYEHRGTSSGTSTLYLDGPVVAEVRETSVRGHPTGSRTVTTRDSIFMIMSEGGQSYIAALPNPAAAMAGRFDALSAADQERFRASAEAIGTDAGRLLAAIAEYPIFGGGAFDREPPGTGQVADEACDVSRFGMVEVCSMAAAPTVMLRTRWRQEWMCMDEKTATRVQRGATVPAGVFAVPADAERVAAPEAAMKVGSVSADRDATRAEVHERIFDAFLAGHSLEQAAAELAGEPLDDYLRVTREKRESMQADLAGMKAEIAGASEANRGRLRELMCRDAVPAWMGG